MYVEPKKDETEEKNFPLKQLTKKHSSEKILKKKSIINLNIRRTSDSSISRTVSVGQSEKTKNTREIAKESWIQVLDEKKIFINIDSYDFNFDILMAECTLIFGQPQISYLANRVKSAIPGNSPGPIPSPA